MPTDPPPDDWARRLLHQAAMTIEVSPAGPLQTPVRRRWPALVAAAAVAALVLGTATLGRGGSDAPGPVVVAPSVPAVTVVPSVFGLDRTEAHARLEQAGLVVTDRPRPGCETPRQAIGTVPVTGERVPADRTVTLLVAEVDATADCTVSTDLRTRAWDFLGFLDGRRPAPAFAATVTIDRAQSIDSRGPDTSQRLTAAQAADPTWVPDTFREALAAADAAMTASDSSPRSCPAGVVDDVRDGGSYLGIVISHYLQDGVTLCPPRVDLHFTDGLIDQIGFPSPALVPLVRVAADYVGLPEGEARSAVAAAGPGVTAYVLYREAGCDTSGNVTAQSPARGRPVRDSVTLTVDVDRADCGRPSTVSETQREVAAELIAWAGGTGPPPPLADPVELYVGHAPAGSAAAGAVPTEWRGCPEGATTYDAYECPLSLLGGIRADAESGAGTDVVARADPLPCGGGLVAARLPARVRSLSSFVLVPGGGLSCLGGYRLQVFLDDRGRIAAVDTALSSP